MSAHAAEGHDPHHDNPYLAHHYDSPEQQYDAAKFGMWLFIATELLLFGGLFVAYAVYRGNNPELFMYGAQFLDTTLGAVNTVVLILSSLTIAWAVRAAQLDQRRTLVTMLALTVLGGCIFMVIKYFEYAEKFEKNLLWGVALYEEIEPRDDVEAGPALALDEDAAETVAVNDEEFVLPRSAVQPPRTGPRGVYEDWEFRATEFRAAEEPYFEHPRYDPDRPENLHHFFGIYFMMTGLHGFHVLVGIGIISVLTVMSIMGRFHSQYFTPVEITGLYWHVVDLIWIFLFPLLYLIH